jgi:hypothetical protein
MIVDHLHLEATAQNELCPKEVFQNVYTSRHKISAS